MNTHRRQAGHNEGVQTNMQLYPATLPEAPPGKRLLLAT
jgi:hypothetical protein